MSFSVIILSKNIANLAPCVAALREYEQDAGIVIVDDGLPVAPGNPGALYRPLKVICGVKPFVYARNVNLGIRAAGEDGVVLLNDDALLESPGGFTLLAQAAADHPEYGIIGVTTNLTGQILQRPAGIGLRQVPHIAFVGVYIPRTTIEKVGLLDERYCLDYGVEDRDYCEAVTRAGLKVGVHDGCYVDHGSLTSSFRGDPKAPRSFQKNYALFKAKWNIA